MKLKGNNINTNNFLKLFPSNSRIGLLDKHNETCALSAGVQRQKGQISFFYEIRTLLGRFQLFEVDSRYKRCL